jgi:transposase-like protein
MKERKYFKSIYLGKEITEFFNNHKNLNVSEIVRKALKEYLEKHYNFDFSIPSYAIIIQYRCPKCGDFSGLARSNAKKKKDIIGRCHHCGARLRLFTAGTKRKPPKRQYVIRAIEYKVIKGLEKLKKMG